VCLARHTHASVYPFVCLVFNAELFVTVSVVVLDCRERSSVQDCVQAWLPIYRNIRRNTWTPALQNIIQTASLLKFVVPYSILRSQGSTLHYMPVTGAS
jgi:hypothetical protein